MIDTLIDTLNRSLTYTYGAETWTLKAPDVRLNSFHNHRTCVKTILGITRFQQWQSCISSQQLSEQFDLYWSITNLF